MSLSTIIADALSGVDWLGQAASGTNHTDSLIPLLIKTAIDGFKAAEGGGSLLTVITDIEADIPALIDAFTANNKQAVVADGVAPSTDTGAGAAPTA